MNQHHHGNVLSMSIWPHLWVKKESKKLYFHHKNLLGATDLKVGMHAQLDSPTWPHLFLVLLKTKSDKNSTSETTLGLKELDPRNPYIYIYIYMVSVSSGKLIKYIYIATPLPVFMSVQQQQQKKKKKKKKKSQKWYFGHTNSWSYRSKSWNA